MEFTVNIALIENQTPIMGVVYAPALRILYFAEKGLESFKAEGRESIEDLNHANTINLSNRTYQRSYT